MSIILLFIAIIVICPGLLILRNFCKFSAFKSDKGMPLLGNIFELAKCQFDLNGVLDQVASQLGRRFVVWASYWFPIVVIGNGKDALKVLRSKQNVKKGLLYKAFDECIGTGTFNSPVSVWKQRRPHLDKAFHAKGLQKLPETFDRCSRKMLESLEKDGRVGKEEGFDFHPYANHCAIQMLLEGALGFKVGDEVLDLTEAVGKYNRGTYIAEYRMLRPWFLCSDFLWSLTSKAKEMLDISIWVHYSYFRKILLSVISHKEAAEEARKETLKTSIETDNSNFDTSRDHLNFLETLLHLQKTRPELNLTEKEILYEMTSIYIAGHDATGKALSFALLYLAHNEDCQEKALEELDRVFGKSERAVSFEDLRELRYLEACIKEALRLMPPVPVITRRVGEDVVLDDKTKIPKGTEVAIVTYLIHRDPEVYQHPEDFKPERFLKEEDNNDLVCSFMPFSAGPRNCQGAKFAMMELKIAAANVLRKFKVEAVGFQKQDWGLSTNITLKLNGGWNILLKRRYDRTAR